MKPIPFNKPYFSGNELEFIRESLTRGQISGNGFFTKKTQRFFEEKYGFKKCLLTTSCTDALEMAALLCDIQPGDEVIMPSYTFVSSANAFVLRGAKIVFIDSRDDHPGMDEDQIEKHITKRTKMIVPVHYAGVACDMDKIMALADKYNLFVVEDAAQAIESTYKGKPLGGIGHLAAFSFHETKNIISGEGGMLIINDPRFNDRAAIIWEKGTNRSAFFKGEVDKYGWVDVGSSFLPSEIIAAFLMGQLENLQAIQTQRHHIWNTYKELLEPLQTKFGVRLPVLPKDASNNAHLFYLVCRSHDERDKLIAHLKRSGISAVFHYQSLHRSPYYSALQAPADLPRCDHYGDCLVRLPFYFELTDEQIHFIGKTIIEFYETELSA